MQLSRRLLDDFLFGVAYSSATAASGPNAHGQHGVLRGLASPPPLQRYLICPAVFAVRKHNALRQKISSTDINMLKETEWR